MKATLSFPSCQHCKVCDSHLILSLIPLLYLKYNRIYILLFLFHTLATPFYTSNFLYIHYTLLHIEFSVDPPHPSTHTIFCVNTLLHIILSTYYTHLHIPHSLNTTIPSTHFLHFHTFLHIYSLHTPHPSLYPT